MKRFITIALICASPASAAPTGLNTIPTADLIPDHQWQASLQNGNPSLGSSPLVFTQPLPLYQFQFGLTPRLEGGIDFGPARSAGDYQPAVNFKWKALLEDYHRPAIAVGIATLGPHLEPSGYAVVTRTLNYGKVQYNKFKAHQRNIKLRGRRVHAGVIHTGDGTFPMVGADWEVSDRFVVYSDWISGGPNAATLGGVYTLNTASSVTASILFSNHAQRPDGMLINYARTFKW